MSLDTSHPADSAVRTSSRRDVLKKTALLGSLGAISAFDWPGLAHADDRAAKPTLPGRQVKVAAICIGFGGDHEQKLKLASAHLETAGQQGVDIACLPEEFAGTTAEPIPGPTINAVAELARKYSMYVICPIREQAGSEQYNTAVLLDRQGKVAGQYRKVFVFWGEGLIPSRDGVKAFDTDFGRISILTCFDLNFPELWQQADLLDVDVVFWPSAYTGGSPLNAMATLYHYYVVPVGRATSSTPPAGLSRSWSSPGLPSSSPPSIWIALSSTGISRRRKWRDSSANTRAKSSRRRIPAPRPGICSDRPSLAFG